MNDVETRLRALADEDAPAPPVEQLVHLIHRRRRRLAGAGAGVAAMAVLVALALTIGGGGPTSLRAADESGSTTSVTEQTTTTAAGVLPLPTTEPTETTETTRPAASPTAKPALVCRNSYDPACGRFRWDPPPSANAMVTSRTTFTPSNPKVGETVTFRVVVDDPDATLDERSVPYGFGDGSPTVNAHPERGEGCPTYRTRYGPWTPPAKVHGHIELTITHVYESDGNFTFAHTVFSGRCDRFGLGAPRTETGEAVYNPYSDYTSELIEVQVRRDDTTTSTTSTTESEPAATAMP